MHRRRFLTGAVAALTPAIAGCGGDDDGDGTTPMDDGDGDGGVTTTMGGGDGGTTTAGSGVPSSVTVELKNSSFDPARAAVAVGGTVEWVNEDSYGHDVTSIQFSDGAAPWDYAESLDGGVSVSRTFDSAGVYEYYCTIHGEGTMCGVVVVGDTSYSGSLPCQGSGGGGY